MDDGGLAFWYLLIERCGICDDLRLAQPRCEIQGEIPLLQLGALNNDALMQRIALCIQELINTPGRAAWNSQVLC